MQELLLQLNGMTLSTLNTTIMINGIDQTVSSIKLVHDMKVHRSTTRMGSTSFAINGIHTNRELFPRLLRYLIDV